MRSLSERTTTRENSSCERGACVGKRDAPYIFYPHHAALPAVRESLENKVPSSVEGMPGQRPRRGWLVCRVRR